MKRRTIPAAVLLAAVAVAAQRPPILHYIRETWPVLTRSNRTLAAAAVDPKFPRPAGSPWPVYVARNEDLRRIEQRLRREMPAAEFRKIELRQLPAQGPGLLYLPRPYVVPGGRFNEMYGWDSYFIQLGLVRDSKFELARDMADNFLYEIREYGKILNANRSYYLTRSQPPFLTEMLLAVYRHYHDREWLSRAVPAIEKYYAYWTSQPHLTAATGLSRYYALGEGPAPEVLSAERDAEGRTHYDRVRLYYRTHKVTSYHLSQYYDARHDQLTALFYKGDRSVRESGFDPSDRFGPFSVDIIHYDPVCLNSLLYLMESQTAEILKLVGRADYGAVWQERAHERAERMNRLLWDERDGLYYDYDFVRRRRRPYPFLTTFYPLWAGIAGREQAARVERNLPRFERRGGLMTSVKVSGDQWDAPYGWAPLEMIAVDGLRRYGYRSDADRIAREFLSLVRDQYRQHGTIVEKYDVVRRSEQVSVQFGYESNQVGFGWTNAVFTKLYDELSPEQQRKLLAR